MATETNSFATIWFLYLLECKSAAQASTYYAGITTDLERRFRQHAAGTGARYTRANRPIRILASRMYANRAEVSRAEVALKKLPRAEKLAFFDNI